MVNYENLTLISRLHINYDIVFLDIRYQGSDLVRFLKVEVFKMKKKYLLGMKKCNHFKITIKEIMKTNTKWN